MNVLNVQQLNRLCIHTFHVYFKCVDTHTAIDVGTVQQLCLSRNDEVIFICCCTSLICCTVVQCRSKNDRCQSELGSFSCRLYRFICKSGDLVAVLVCIVDKPFEECIVSLSKCEFSSELLTSCCCKLKHYITISVLCSVSSRIVVPVIVLCNDNNICQFIFRIDVNGSVSQFENILTCHYSDHFIELIYSNTLI